jgi:peptidoglycan hydrolase CwlO-like protein
VSQDCEAKIRELEQQVRSLNRLIETIVDQVGRDAERITELEQEIERLKRIIWELSSHG